MENASLRSAAAAAVVVAVVERVGPHPDWMRTNLRQGSLMEKWRIRVEFQRPTSGICRSQREQPYFGLEFRTVHHCPLPVSGRRLPERPTVPSAASPRGRVTQVKCPPPVVQKFEGKMLNPSEK